MKTYPKQYIGGEWKEGTGSSILKDINPYTNEVIYEYRSASKQDVDEAYEKASEAQKIWAKTSPAEKVACLRKLEEEWTKSIPDISEILVEEGGGTLMKGAGEPRTVLNVLRQAYRMPYMMQGKIMPSDIPGKDNYVVRNPKGVILVIAPFNFPIMLAMRSVIPALATGNAVVLKPSSDTPATAMAIAEVIDRCDFPKGLFSAIAGKGSEIGDYIVAHPTPSLLSFTGSTEVGSHVGAIATSGIKDVSLELGGNNSMIVLDDADVERAASATAMGALGNQGQVCMALNRAIVCPKVYDEYVEKVAELFREKKCGDPKDPEVEIGPIINTSQAERIKEIIEETIKAGARVVVEGKFDGNVISPWVFADATMDMPAAKEEVFGPVLTIIKAKDEDDAVNIANDTIYGLSNAVFTGDLYHGMQVAQRMDSGMVHVNDSSVNDEQQVMFGGVKRSGLGRFNAEWVVDKFTYNKWISVQTTYRF